MLVTALVTLAAAPGWIIGAPPHGYGLVEAEQLRDGTQIARYWHPTLDPDDAPLVLSARSPGQPPPAAPQTTVHGQPARFDDLTGDGATYGRGLQWNEPSGVTLRLE